MSRYAISAVLASDLVRRSGVDAVLAGDASIILSGITQDSRVVETGDLYCCISGASFDGHLFATDAVSRGARALLVDRHLPDIAEDILQIQVPNVRSVLGSIAAEAFHRPSDSLHLIGITGTNGKTTTAAILSSLLEAEGFTCEVLGTLTDSRTTLEAIDLHNRLHDFLARGVTHVVMEVSSHALDQHRVDGLMFDLAIFTNLSHDHLDYHSSFDEYFTAKARLFSAQLTRSAVVNRDDACGRVLIDTKSVPTVTYGSKDISDMEVRVDSSTFMWDGLHISLPLGGGYAPINALAAITAAREIGVSHEHIQRGCAVVSVIPGRFEYVGSSNGATVVVDFAHTPDGLAGVLQSARALTTSAVHVVFGCGGDRDHTKRSVMGKIASDLADYVYVTSDNPRSEDPAKIISAIMEGALHGNGTLSSFVNRADAIESAILAAEHGDIVVIAGKGHETTQEIQGVMTPFNDAEIAQAVLERQKGKAT